MHQQLADRYVLLGWTATGLTDNYSTSIEPQCPGVMMHGAMFNAIINRDFWTHSSWWVGAMLTLILGALTTLSVAYLSVYRALLATALIVAGYVLLNGLVLFDYGNHIVAAAPPIGAAVMIWFGVTVGKIIYEQRERSRITKRFSDYTDPAIVDLVVDNPELAHFEGQVREISVVFTDLAGFTSLSEKLRERTVPLLNKYMSLMLPIIRESGGYWNKFLGDGIMFFYNAPEGDPEHAAKAIRAVLQMREAMIPFNADLQSQGLPPLAMRAGIATGMMIVGDAGSTEGKERAHDYTVLGDEVNLGARLESANKILGSNILINARTAELASDQVLLRPMGTVQVMGKTEGVPVFEALCLHSEATDRHKTLVELSTQIVEHFRAARFDACIEAATRLGPGKFAELYTELARKYLNEPPAGPFDGQIVLSAK
jgi:adenylate cyclase